MSKKATKAGVKRTLKGTVPFPAAVSKAQACTGKVMLTIKRSGRSILNQEVPLTKRCTFSRSVTTKRAKPVVLGQGHVQRQHRAEHDRLQRRFS